VSNSRPWIVEVRFTDECVDKLQSKHRVSPEEVEEAVRFDGYVEAGWHDHPKYGRRLLVIGYTYKRQSLLVILKPYNEDDGVWDCKTARRI
jgi:hypothetical protein